MLLLESHSLLLMGPSMEKSSDGLYPDCTWGKPAELLKDVRKIYKISAKKESRVRWRKERFSGLKRISIKATGFV